MSLREHPTDVGAATDLPEVMTDTASSTHPRLACEAHRDLAKRLDLNIVELDTSIDRLEHAVKTALMNGASSAVVWAIVRPLQAELLLLEAEIDSLQRTLTSSGVDAGRAAPMTRVRNGASERRARLRASPVWSVINAAVRSVLCADMGDAS